MKKIIATLCFSLLCVTVARAEEYRIFTDAQGRSIEAKIVDFDSVMGTLKIERDDGKTSWVSPGVFSEADQKYIQEWVVADQMLSENNLRISFKKKSDPIDEKGTPQKTGFDGEAVYFEITLENRSNQAIENLEIEYRYFITVDVKDRDAKIRQVSGRTTISRIDAMSPFTMATDAVTFGEKIQNIPIHDRYGRLQGYDEKTLSDEDLEGIWLRIHGSKIGGQPSIRDVCYPSGLEKKMIWGEPQSPQMERAMQLGIVTGINELNAWLIEALRELDMESDEVTMREISKAIEVVYDDKVDAYGACATAIAMGFYRKGLYDLAVLWLEKREETKGTGFLPRTILAELYASAPSVCDGAKAVKYAKQVANDSASASDPWVLHVLARAYARDGQFDFAATTQEQALAKLPQRKKERYQAFFERCLTLYKAGKSYDLNDEDPLCWCLNIIIRTNTPANPEQQRDYLWPDEDGRNKGKYLISANLHLMY